MCTKKLSRHECETLVNHCVQVNSGLYVYEADGSWSLVSDFHKSNVTRTVLHEPIFSKRRDFGIANFKNQLIFVTGGFTMDSNSQSSDAFCYKVKSDEWLQAPYMTQ